MNISILWFPFESVPKVFSQSETQASHCPSWDTVPMAFCEKKLGSLPVLKEWANRRKVPSGM